METVRRVGLDTNIFMGIFLDEKEKLTASLTILKLISNGNLEGVISSLSIIEVATLFYQKEEIQKGKKAISFMKALPNIIVVDITSDTAFNIANIKVSEKLSIADAIILSASVELSANAFLTYDNDFAKVERIKYMRPEDYLKILKENGTNK